MSTTIIDVNIPYASGLVGGISGTQVADSNGHGWCWIGGNNDRKIFSIRMQEDENYWFVEVSEVDDLQSPTEKTVLYSEAINSQLQNLYTTRTSNIEMCRLSSSAVYMKVLTSTVRSANNAGSYHYVIEIDEPNGNTVSVTDLDQQIPNFLMGGAYNYSGNAYQQGFGIHHRFMYQLEENKILTYEPNESGDWGGGSLVERSWDPVTKSLTNRIVCSNYRNPNIRSQATWRTADYSGYGDTWSFVPELDQNNFQVMRPSDVDVDLVSSYNNWPVMHGHASDYYGDSAGYSTMRWLSVVTGRDGLLHFGAAQEGTGQYQNHYWSNFNANMAYNEYFITYNPSDGSWGLTGRRCDDPSLPGGREDFGVWLPLNTMPVSDYAAEVDKDLSTFNGVENSRTFKTWMLVGGREQQVQGISSGSPQIFSSSEFQTIWEAKRTDPYKAPNESLQSMWLDEEHFIVFSWYQVESSGMSTSYSYNLLYTIYRYFDENKIEMISHGSVQEYNTPQQYHQFTGGNIFQRYSTSMLLSDKFADNLATLSAGPAPADSDGS